MKTLFTIILIMISCKSNSQSLAIIDDPDGYTNMREGPGNTYKMIDQISKNEVFIIEDLKEDWYLIYKVENGYKEGFMHESRVLLIYSLPTIGEREFRNDYLVISNPNFEFKIRRGKFDKSEHKYTFENNKHVLKIDDRVPYGVDGGYPTTEIEEISLTIDGKSIHIPDTAYSDLYNINYENIEIRKTNDGTLFINMLNNSDGAGYYNAVWIFQDKRILRRLITIM